MGMIYRLDLKRLYWFCLSFQAGSVFRDLLFVGGMKKMMTLLIVAVFSIF